MSPTRGFQHFEMRIYQYFIMLELSATAHSSLAEILSLGEKTLVAAGHVPPVTNTSTGVELTINFVDLNWSKRKATTDHRCMYIKQHTGKQYTFEILQSYPKPHTSPHRSNEIYPAYWSISVDLLSRKNCFAVSCSLN